MVLNYSIYCGKYGLMAQNKKQCKFDIYGRSYHFDGLVQERRISIANALELHLSCTNPLICALDRHVPHNMCKLQPANTAPVTSDGNC